MDVTYERRGGVVQRGAHYLMMDGFLIDTLTLGHGDLIDTN